MDTGERFYRVSWEGRHLSKKSWHQLDSKLGYENAILWIILNCVAIRQHVQVFSRQVSMRLNILSIFIFSQ